MIKKKKAKVKKMTEEKKGSPENETVRKEKVKETGLEKAPPELTPQEMRPFYYNYQHPYGYRYEAGYEPGAGEVHLIDYINVLLKWRWLIIVGVLLCVVTTGVVSKRMTPVFTASARFLPSRSPEMVSRMGTLIGAGGKIEGIEENVTSEFYAELIKSNVFLERIAQRKFNSRKMASEIDLATYYKIKANDETEKRIKTLRAISGNLKVSIDRNTKIVTVSYSTSEPALSAEIVNAILEELIRYNQDIRDSKAKQNRIFIEKQLAETQELLRRAEAELADFTARNKKIVTPDLEIELDRLKRNVKVQEEVFITLKRQLELAKIEEEEKKPAIEVIERALPPLTKSKPRTKMNVILAAFVSGFLFVMLAFVLEYFSKMNPDEERHRQFRRYLSDFINDFRRVGRLFRPPT